MHVCIHAVLTVRVCIVCMDKSRILYLSGCVNMQGLTDYPYLYTRQILMGRMLQHACVCCIKKNVIGL